MPEIRLTVSICRQNPRHADGCIAIHSLRIHPLRFWRFSGWFVACFTVLPSETRSGRLGGARNESFMLNGAEKLLFITVTWGRIKREINKSEPQKLATKKMEGNPYDKKDN